MKDIFWVPVIFCNNSTKFKFVYCSFCLISKHSQIELFMLKVLKTACCVVLETGEGSCKLCRKKSKEVEAACSLCSSSSIQKGLGVRRCEIDTFCFVGPLTTKQKEMEKEKGCSGNFT